MSLFDNAVLMTGYATLQHLFTGADPQRHGNTSPDTCPSGVFQAQDRSFYINCGNDKIFQRLMSQVIDRPDLASAEIYATGTDRIRRRDELFAILGEAFAQQPWSYWQSRMRAAGVPCGQVRTVGEAIRSPEARERALVTRIPHPQAGLGAECEAADPLFADAGRGSRRRARGGSAHRRGVARDARLR